MNPNEAHAAHNGSMIPKLAKVASGSTFATRSEVEMGVMEVLEDDFLTREVEALASGEAERELLPEADPESDPEPESDMIGARCWL